MSARVRPHYLTALLVLAASMFVPSPAHAQPTVPEVGDRVRLLTTGGMRHVGQLTAVSSDLVEIRTDGGPPQAFVWDGVRRLEVSRGMQPGNKVGAMAVLFGMPAATATLAAVTWKPCDSTGLNCILSFNSKGQAATVWSLLGFLVALPMAIGLGNEREAWVGAEAPIAVHLDPSEARGSGLGISLRLRF